MIQVYFTMSSIHFSDTLYVYDGPDTNAPLIGAYNNFTNPVLSLLAIDASLNNPSGCLTVRFVSGSQNEAQGFNAEVSCEPICQEITAELNMALTNPAPDTNYIAVCPGTEINFSATSSFPENDIIYHQSEATTTYEWIFGDGTTATGQNVSHTYAEIGGYTVSLFATDINGCVSSNSIETRVVIAGSPFVGSIPPDPICANDTTILDFTTVSGGTSIVDGTPFHEEISTTLGVSDTTFLPDGTGDCYETSVVFNCFEPGQTLDDPQDFLSLDVNMEHSFLGDLEISLICPNGQSLVLKSFTDAGGSTGYGSGVFLGEPIDDDSDLNPGVGWDYSWTPITPTYSNMGAEAEATWPTSLPSGSYAPFGTFYDLVGCPLNGQWTIEICDNWGSDNGYIFSWEMTLNPDIAPDAWEYTVGIDQYSWGSGPYIINQTNEAISVSPTVEGFFNYTYNVVDHYGCAWDTTVTLEVLPTPNVNLGPDLTFCPGINSHIFNAQNPGNNYTWQDGSNAATFNAIVAGDYSVTVSNGLCQDIDSVTIHPHTGFTNISSHTNVSCFEGSDGTANISTTTDYPPYFYNWSDGQTGEQANNLTMGDYYITITDNAGCLSFDTITINQPTAVLASHTSTVISCFGGDDGEIDLSVSGGSPSYTYQWDNGETNQDIINLTARTYRVSITDSHNCLLVYDVPVTQAGEITTDLPDDHYYCSEIEEILSSSATGGNAPYTYEWSTGSLNESISVSPTQNTMYQVTVTDSKDCKKIDFVNISIYPELELTVGVQDTIVCPGESTFLNINIEGGSGHPYTTMLNGETTSFPLYISPIDNETFQVEIKDNCFHSISKSVTLFNYPEPLVSFSANILEGCPPLTVQFNETNNDDNSQYLWEFSNSINTPNTAIIHNPKHIFNESGTYDVTLKVTNEFGCINSFTKHQMVFVYPKPLAKFTATPNLTTVISPNISFVNKSEDASAYIWNFGNGQVSQSEAPNYTYNSIGEYKTSLIAISARGCKDTTEALIKIKEEFTFYAPDAFTPDFDGKNETFKVFGNGIDNDNFLLQIYDRWGMPMFESTDINIGWDGKVNNSNKVAQVASYQWICVYKDTNGIEHEKSGSVSLVR